MKAHHFDRNSLAKAGLFAALLALTVALPLVPAADAADPCGNEDIRKGQTSEVLPQGTVSLPACMALELVSPPKKFGQEATEPRAFSPDGNRILFNSKAALAETGGLQTFIGDSYVASRGPDGWATDATSPPVGAEIVAGSTRGGGPYAFDPDLDGWVLFGCTQAQKLAGEGQVFRGGIGGFFAPLSPLLVPIDDSGTDQILFFCKAFGGSLTVVSEPSGTAADLSATAFRTDLGSTGYLPEDPRGKEEGEEGENNSYLAFLDAAGEPSLQLLARDQNGKVWGGRCGSNLGGERGLLNQGAISADGSRLFITTRPAQPFDPTHPSEAPFSPPCSGALPLRILERSGEGPEIKELIPGPGGPTEAGSDLFQGASLDGSKVFLATTRALSPSDEDSGVGCSSTLGASGGCDLYLYDADLPAGERLIQVSAGEDISGQHEAGKGADVLSSITAISPDGSHAYFVAEGVLTEENAEHESPTADEPNLYLYERDAAHPAGHLTFVATLAEGDKGRLWGSGKSFVGGAYAVPLLGGGAEGGGDGHILFLLSKASLSSEDADGGYADVFRYESLTGTLSCVSCAIGGPDSAPFEVSAGANVQPPSSNFAEQGRWASEDGGSAVFVTAESLVAGDEDGAFNPYLWREGQLALLPGDMSKIPSVRANQLPLLSPDGEEAAFTATSPLLLVDGDTARDTYLVRVGGGFPNPVAVVPCDPLSEGACRGPASAASNVPVPITPSFVGPGNEKAPAKCKKGQVRRRGNCVKAHKKKKAGKHRRASHNGGGSR